MRLFLIFCLAFAVPKLYAQISLPDPTLAKDFAAQVKSIDEFMARFNGEESKPDIRKDSLSRRDNILSLFDFRIKHDDLSNEEFKAKLSDFTNTVCHWDSKLVLKDAEVYAEIICSTTYNKKICKVILIMQKESINKDKARWGIVGVKGLKQAGFYNDKLATISPVDHEVHFMSLIDLYQVSSQLAPSFRSKKKNIDDFSLFTGMIIAGGLKFKSIDRVRFHFLSVPNYTFVVDEIGRNGTNSGWLITEFGKKSPKEKQEYKNYLLGIKDI